MINNTLVLIKALLLGALLTLASTSLYATDTKKMSNPSVKLSTNQGDIIIELNAEAAPKTVANFIAYVEDGFYSGLIFHRVIPGFMVQGGGYMADYKQKDTKDQIENEADNGLKNDRGTIAMARTGEPHSATGQFFINDANNDFLNHSGKTQQGWGYAVFGKVTEGMDVVDKITAIPTGRGGMFPTDVPQEEVIIEKAEMMK
jgi:peptidyl-prolyl cis-trans isomerase B (cyclophilin B)|tara:strand:- start:27537 stop:28142 length:606 start_codon:yes stop_codon:yes gene_type:complete